ncbi:MAG TPA: CHRD domain-containing protein [Reyranella sp.]|nr:CHRD domain-containing protein [Reyranella sp.]
MKASVLPALAALAVAGCQLAYMSDPAGPKPQFKATLAGANETPPTASAGYGVMEARYMPTMHTLEWRLYFGKLSGPVTYAFLQGPDGVGNERADIVPINPPFEGNIQKGGATLTEAQAADLLAGKWSVEIRTGQYPNGEIRGALVLQ